MELVSQGLLSMREENLNEVVTELHYMMLAGESLIGNALANLMMDFWRHSFVYEKVKTLLRNTSSSLISDHIPYLEMVANEIRRVYPYVPCMVGKAKNDFIFNGYAIPKGYRVIAAFYSTNHDSKEWTNPFTFEPDRYERGEPHSGMKTTWMPHGMIGSRHMCAGTDFSTQLLILFMKRLAHFDATWILDSMQDFEQRMELLYPEPKSKVRCLSFVVKNPSAA